MEIVYIAAGIAIGAVIGYLIAKTKTAGTEANNKLLSENLIKAESDADSEREKVLELSNQLSGIKTLYDKINIEFENLANKILEENSKRFSEQNKDKLDSILNPLKEKIDEFNLKVERTYKAESDERNILKGEINRLVELNRRISEDAENLTNALKGDKKKQGDWGEDRLELLLEKAGLKKDLHFKTQETLKDEEGKLKRLDVIVYLPDNKCLVIDSKVSLNDYTNFYNTDDEEQRRVYLKKHIDCIYSHIEDLSSRNYHQLYGVNSPEYVLMYIPIEPAFYMAVESDKELFLWALEKKNIVLVTTTTLLATLSTVSFIWSQENQKRNVLEIARQSGALYDKFAGFVDDLIEIGKRLDSAKISYSDAMKKLSEGSGNLIKRVEDIKKLGAKTSKSIDQRILDRAAEMSEEDEMKLLKSK